MKISLNWLKDFVKIPDSIDPKALADELTLKTAEVESVTFQAEKFDKIVAGQVIELLAHPNADKLKLTKTSVGKETHQIVCGGENLKEGMYVAVALPGAKVRWHGEGELVTLEAAKIRGEDSFGMICASSELGLESKKEGPRDILDLSSLKPTPGTSLAELLDQSDTIFEFDNKALTHRPDLWGHYGIAREIAAIKGLKLKMLKPKITIPAQGESVSVEIKNFELCPRFCGIIINNIKVKESPAWLKSRLKAAGHGTHNNIVDVTNYVMTEIGQPMHAFDKNFIKGGIIIRNAYKGEKITTLDGKERSLNEEIGLVADHEKAVGVAGIIGGQNSEINSTTTSIILEAANWHPAILRRASIALGVRTDAVQRFEKSLDPCLSELAILRAAELILKICKGALVAGPMTDITDPKKPNLLSAYPINIKLDINKAISKIGVKIPSKEIVKILKSLEFKIEKKEKNIYTVAIPSHRATKDVLIEDDLIEEIARIYGYDNIETSLPSLPARLPLENTERFKKHRARELFSYGLGFDEVMNYSFYGKKELENCLMTEAGHLKLLNYLSEDQTHLRTSLIPNLLKNIDLNSKYFDSFKLYEIGRTYKEIGEYFPLEEKFISGAIAQKGKTDEIFYAAKSSVEAFFDRFNIKGISSTKGIKATPYAHPVKSLTYLSPTGQTLARVFMLHPTVQRNTDLEKYSIALFEVNFTESLRLENPIKKFTQLPKFPSIKIDISVVMNQQQEIETIKEEIFKADNSLIRDIELFDIYEGENVEKGKKAIAFRITLQALDRTLTDQDMTKVQTNIFTNLEKIGGQIRGNKNTKVQGPDYQD